MIKTRTCAAALLLIAAFAAPAFAADHDLPDKGEIAGLEGRDFELAAFDKIKIETVAAIHVRQGGKQSVRVSTEPEHFAALEIEVDDGTLVIGHDPGDEDDDDDVEYHVAIDITVPALSAFTVEGVIKGELEDIEAAAFALDFEGVGELTIAGSCDDGDFDISGVGAIDTRDFHCKTLDAEVSGVGDVHLHASDAIELEVSGIGRVTVHGDPEKRHVRESGLGGVTFR